MKNLARAGSDQFGLRNGAATCGRSRLRNANFEILVAFGEGIEVKSLVVLERKICDLTSELMACVYTSVKAMRKTNELK